MQRVVTIELNGQSCNFDEDAYDALRAYLRRAEAQLASDPRRAEILSDLERSISDKCPPFVDGQKNVVTAEELRAVLAQIGVVTGDREDAQTGAARETSSRIGDRQLVQIRAGAMVSGVCNGLAAYVGIDVTLVRVIFIVLTLATSGALLLVYLALMFLIPYDTNVERINDQSLPGFMFKLVRQTKRKFASSG